MWLIYALSAAIIWGLDYTLGEEIFKKRISPVSLLAMEMFLGSIALGIIAYFTQLKADINILMSDRSALWLFLAILVTFNLGNFLIFCSIQAGKNATLVALVELCYPIFTILFSWFLFQQNHLTPSVIIGGILIFTGIAIISYFNHA